MNIYVFTCKTHKNIDEACIMKERSLTNVYSAQLICSLLLKFDWSNTSARN